MNKILGAMMLTALPVAAGAQMAAPMPAATYVMKAGAGDLFERKSSEVVLMSTKNAKLRTFAKMMVSDHTTSTAEVKAAAMKAGMTPKPPMLTAKQSHDVAALKAATGTKRDALYITQQKAAHQEALTVQQGYATNGSVAPLKATAAKIVPVVQQHIQELEAM